MLPIANFRVNEADFGEPDWETILEIAFPTWTPPANGCPRLDVLGGSLVEGYAEFPEYEEGKWNPCYYTKAFAGLDPKLGGYPTPIDTKYVYEFAAPYMKQAGDGSTHHCAAGETDVGACPKAGGTCGKDCAAISDEFGGISHIPPFVPLAAVKNAYNSCSHDVCAEWFDYDTSGCNIVKSKLDELVIDQFGADDGTAIRFQPPILIDGEPSSTYYRLEFGGESPACDDGNCRGPHYCTKDVADAGNVWGDYCPYVSTGDNSGLYRHPHLALAALELWIANQCMPDMCAPQWLDSPNGAGYASSVATSTSITWSEMVDNSDPMSQPKVPLEWPNSGDGVFPGHEALYGDLSMKNIPGAFIMDGIDYMGTAPVDGPDDEPVSEPADEPSSADEPVAAPADEATVPSSAFAASVALAAPLAALVGAIVM